MIRWSILESRVHVHVRDDLSIFVEYVMVCIALSEVQ